MNRLLKNSGGQSLYFTLPAPGGGVVVGDTGMMYLSIDGGAVAALGTPVVSQGNGLYQQALTTAETNGDILAFSFVPATGGVPGIGECIRTESSFAGGDAVLAAAQPHYAPYKVGDLVLLAANQDIRNVLGNVNGDVLGDLAGVAGSVTMFSPDAINAFLDQGAGVQVGLTVREGLRQLVAALVNVHPTFISPVHLGPTVIPIQPRFPYPVRLALYNATAALTKVLEVAEANPDPLVLSQDMRSACMQLAVAIDAVRTSSL
jgi:hypothetical protein